MGWLGTKKIAIKAIALPGNFAATKAAARILDLATSVREHGLIHLPVVEAKTMRLLVGHDRIAALMTLKEKRVEVRIWEGTAREFRRTQLSENFHRRNDDKPAMTAAYALLEEEELTREVAAQDGETEYLTQSAHRTAVRGTAKRVKEEANAVVAAVRGIKPASVTRAKTRAKAKEDEASSTAGQLPGGSKHAPAVEAKPAPLVALEHLPDHFNAFGLDVTDEHRVRVRELSDALGLWARQTVNLLTELSRIEKISNPPLISRQAAEAIRDKAHALGHVVREAIPTSLCFYCKNDDRAVVHCPACGSTGFVGRHAGDNVPPELKTTGVAARISLDGRFILHDTIVGSKGGTPLVVTPQFRRAQKKIRVVTVDREGAETEVNLDEVPPPDDDELAF